LRNCLDLEEVDDVLDDARFSSSSAGLAGVPHPGERAVVEVLVAAEHEVVEHREVVEQLDVLEHPGHAERGDRRRAAAEQVLAEEADRALLGPVDARDAVEDRGLAGAVRADDGEQLTGRTSKLTAVDGRCRRSAGARSSTSRIGPVASSRMRYRVRASDRGRGSSRRASGQPALAALVVLDVAEGARALLAQAEVELLDVLVLAQLAAGLSITTLPVSMT
jgi:hypothetical protein